MGLVGSKADVKANQDEESDESINEDELHIQQPEEVNRNSSLESIEERDEESIGDIEEEEELKMGMAVHVACQSNDGDYEEEDLEMGAIEYDDSKVESDHTMNLSRWGYY
mmetsp:Transcript_8756/g.14546  ORF Transcript_8756/g.14546 Transcript_8756/m.14546 type:complete len:110 (+) Transcript_8756:3-332(+)